MNSFTGTRSEKFEVFLEILQRVDPDSYEGFTKCIPNWCLDPRTHDFLLEQENFFEIRNWYTGMGFDITPELLEEFVTVDLYS